jgi:hypothetical protein
MLALLLSVLIMAAWANFILLPFLNQNQELKDELGSIKDSMRQMEMIITSGSDLPMQLEKVQEKLAAFRALLPEPMSTDKMDDLVTALLQQYGLLPQNLIITAVAEKPVVAYQYSEVTIESLKGVLPTAEVRFICKGSANAFFTMLQGIEQNHKYLRVLQYSFTKDLTNNASFNPDFVDTIQGSFLIYMFRK